MPKTPKTADVEGSGKRERGKTHGIDKMSRDPIMLLEILDTLPGTESVRQSFPYGGAQSLSGNNHLKEVVRVTLFQSEKAVHALPTEDAEQAAHDVPTGDYHLVHDLLAGDGHYGDE